MESIGFIYLKNKGRNILLLNNHKNELFTIMVRKLADPIVKDRKTDTNLKGMIRRNGNN
jgi:hypothetical protein